MLWVDILANADNWNFIDRLTYPSTLNEVLEADYSQRIQLKFQLQSRLNAENVQVHQAFIRFYNEKTKQEIIFIAEQDSAGVYKVDLNLQVRSKDFNNLSGQYKLNLIIGDALVINSIDWNIATLSIQFGSQATSPTSNVADYSPKPEIRHIYREMEIRPHPLVSNFFTLLVIVPFVALFIMVNPIITLTFSRFNLTYLPL